MGGAPGGGDADPPVDAMKQVTPATLAAALATLNGGAPVEVRPMSMSWDAFDIAEHHQGVAERIYATLPDQPDALLKLEQLCDHWTQEADTIDRKMLEDPRQRTGANAALSRVLGQAIGELRAAIYATSAAAGEGGEG